MVLFGATGDLSHRKVFPALAQLWRTNLLPTDWALLAVGRRPTTTSRSGRTSPGRSTSTAGSQLEPEMERDFLSRISYIKGDFADNALFDSMTERLETMHEEHATGHNILFYLATQPSAFPQIVSQIGRCGLDHEKHDGGWRRIIIEKPFGRDLDSARKLNREMLRVFRETQVYRIDHYLGKETVRNLLVFRFGNGIFEPLWNRRYVDHIQITVAEDVGVEGRGAFYEEAGASRDILQNHLLQLLSLVAMEPPRPSRPMRFATRSSRSCGRSRRPRSRRSPTTWSAAIRQGLDRGHGVKGYREEPEVDRSRRQRRSWPRSSTSRTGAGPACPSTAQRQALAKRATEIAIQFRDVPHRLFEDADTDPGANLLAIRVQPDEGILLRFNSKVPGLGLEIPP